MSLHLKMNTFFLEDEEHAEPGAVGWVTVAAAAPQAPGAVCGLACGRPGGPWRWGGWSGQVVRRPHQFGGGGLIAKW